MIRLENSEVLGRPIRKDELGELGISTVTRILDAIDGGKPSEARDLVRYLWAEGKALHDLYADWTWALMDFIAEKMGEDELFHVLKKTQEWRRRRRAERYVHGGMQEGLQLTAEFLRAHRSGPEQLGTFVLRDEGDRYVIDLDPCGSGGKMRRPDPVDGTPARTEAPYSCGTVQKAYPWTWGKPGIARYCVHCCVNEIIEIESVGYPICIHEYPDDPQQPCRWLFYKDPESIPEAYFTRVGKSKGHPPEPSGKLGSDSASGIPQDGRGRQ